MPPAPPALPLPAPSAHCLPWLLYPADAQTGALAPHVCTPASAEAAGACSAGDAVATYENHDAFCPENYVQMPDGCIECPAGYAAPLRDPATRLLEGTPFAEDASHACTDCDGLLCAEGNQTTFVMPLFDARGLLKTGDRFYVEVKVYSSAEGSVPQAQADTDLVTVDQTPPFGGIVNDGLSSQPGGDVDYVSNVSQLHAWWYDFKDDESPIIRYQACVGTQRSYCDITQRSVIDVPNAIPTGNASNQSNHMSWDASLWPKAQGATFCVHVEATNAALLTALATSDCLTIDHTPPVMTRVEVGIDPKVDSLGFTALSMDTKSSSLVIFMHARCEEDLADIEQFEICLGSSPGECDLAPPRIAQPPAGNATVNSETGTTEVSAAKDATGSNATTTYVGVKIPDTVIGVPFYLGGRCVGTHGLVSDWLFVNKSTVMGRVHVEIGGEGKSGGASGLSGRRRRGCRSSAERLAPREPLPQLRRPARRGLEGAGPEGRRGTALRAGQRQRHAAAVHIHAHRQPQLLVPGAAGGRRHLPASLQHDGLRARFWRLHRGGRRTRRSAPLRVGKWRRQQRRRQQRRRWQWRRLLRTTAAKQRREQPRTRLNDALPDEPRHERNLRQHVPAQLLPALHAVHRRPSPGQRDALGAAGAHLLAAQREQWRVGDRERVLRQPGAQFDLHSAGRPSCVPCDHLRRGLSTTAHLLCMPTVRANA